MKDLFVGLFTGIFFAVGWVLFIDAQINSLDAFDGKHVIPCLLATAAAIAMNLVSISRVKESMEVKLWLFFWFTVSCVSIGLSIWFLARDYAPPIPPYPGISILLQSVFTLIAGFLYFAARKKTSTDDYFYADQ